MSDILVASHKDADGMWRAVFSAGCGHDVTFESGLILTDVEVQKLRDRQYHTYCPECRKRLEASEVSP